MPTSDLTMEGRGGGRCKNNLETLSNQTSLDLDKGVSFSSCDKDPPPIIKHYGGGKTADVELYGDCVSAK